MSKYRPVLKLRLRGCGDAQADRLEAFEHRTRREGDLAGIEVRTRVEHEFMGYYPASLLEVYEAAVA